MTSFSQTTAFLSITKQISNVSIFQVFIWTAFRAFLLLILFTLYGCGGNPSNSNIGNSAAQSDPSIEVIGNGSVKVALLLPKSATGTAGQTGQIFQNAAELALLDSPSSNVQLLVIDTGATNLGGRQAARKAISNGAEIILGPVFAPAVKGAAEVARVSNVPILAFSPNIENAAPGVYLLAFLPQDDVNRIISYSASQDRKSFVAVLPNNITGAVIEASFRQAVSDVEGRIISIVWYEINPETGASANEIATKILEIRSIAEQTDAVLIPVGGNVGTYIGETLANSGFNKEQVQFLGTGTWDTEGVNNSPSLAGGWYPAPSNVNFFNFSQKYKEIYGFEPQRKSTLAYDAVILAVGLTNSLGSNRFSQNVLTNESGFRGIDGLFRFTPGGFIERGLAIYEVTENGPRIIDPAPRSFSGSLF